MAELSESKFFTPEMRDLESRLGYEFRDRQLIVQALTHRSCLSDGAESLHDNENMEFLGDAVLELAISEMLYRHFADRYREGDLTKMRAYLVSEPRLAEKAGKLGLGNVLQLSRGEEKSGGRERPSILADAFEAVTGAIFLDGGFEAARSFLERQFLPSIELVPHRGLLNDYKSRLQELTQKYFHFVPSYRTISVSGPDHDRTFEVGLFFSGREVSRGTGRTKKEAEQKAARMAIENFEGITSENGIR